MADENRPPALDESVARVTVATDTGLLPLVIDFAGRVTRRLGLEDESVGKFGRVIETVCGNVIEYAFGPDETGKYDVEVLRRPGHVVVAVEDRGLPFDYVRLQDGEDATLSEMLHQKFVDEIRFKNLGRLGNRVELVKHLSQADVRDHLSEDEHREVLEAPAAHEELPLEIRVMRPEEAFELSRCVYRSYGYSYDWDSIYYPDRIRELQERGQMRSCVALAPDGEFVGHLAMRVEHPEAPVGEAGQAVVDPRFRGHHLFPKMKTFLAELAAREGMYGLYSEATAVHPYSQRGNLKLGARETGFLLGYIPASVSYKEIGEDREGRRGSVALFYMRTNPELERIIYPPAACREAVRRIVEHNSMRRKIEDGSHAELPDTSRMSVEVRRDHNLAFLKVEEPGADLRALIRARLKELCLHRIDCVYLDLPLSHPALQSAGTNLDELGFFFGGVVPELRDGDVLRLQYLNEVEIRPEDVRTGSDFGQELVDLIFREKSAVER